jgi:hypothetical protein
MPEIRSDGSVEFDAASGLLSVRLHMLATPGSVLLLANYTYQPIDSLTIDLRLDRQVTRAHSTDGVSVQLEKTETGVRLHLPLNWTDAVLLDR